MDVLSSRKPLLRGFTLIELLIATGIVTILVSLAVPNLSELYVSNRLSAAANEFLAALADARSEAMRRGVPVTLVSTSGSTNWTGGWTLCVDSNAAKAAGTCATGTTDTLRRGAVLTAPLTMYSNATFSKAVTFDSNGRVVNTAANGAGAPTYPGLFVLCHGSEFQKSGKSRSRAIVVNAVGRIRQGMDSDNNGIPEGEGTTDISGSCAAPTP